MTKNEINETETNATHANKLVDDLDKADAAHRRALVDLMLDVEEVIRTAIVTPDMSVRPLAKERTLQAAAARYVDHVARMLAGMGVADACIELERGGDLAVCHVPFDEAIRAVSFAHPEHAADNTPDAAAVDLEQHEQRAREVIVAGVERVRLDLFPEARAAARKEASRANIKRLAAKLMASAPAVKR